jgi:hypothetical protein
VAPELLGALTIGRGSAQSGGGGGGGHRSQIILPSHPKYTKTAKKRRLCARFGLLFAENAVFRSKVLKKICSRSVVGKVTVTPLQSYITSYFLE